MNENYSKLGKLFSEPMYKEHAELLNQPEEYRETLKRVRTHFGLVGIGLPAPQQLIDDIFGKHFPEQDEVPVKWPENGQTVEEWNSKPHKVLAIQYRQSNTAAVMDFMHKNSIEFFSCKHGELWYLQSDRQALMEFGDWILVRDYEDGSCKPSLLDDKDFVQEYGPKKNTYTEYDAEGVHDSYNTDVDEE